MKAKRNAVRTVFVLVLFFFTAAIVADGIITRYGRSSAAFAAAPQAQILPPDAVTAASRAVAILRIYTINEGRKEPFIATASGWFADRRTLVTTAHAFGPEKINSGKITSLQILRMRTFPFYNVTARVTLVKEYSARGSYFVSRNIGGDIGLIREIDTEDIGETHTALVRTKIPSPGERVWWKCANRQEEWFSGKFLFEGYPATSSPMEPYDDWQYLFRMYVFLSENGGPYGGCSGAPVFDEQGRVAGMLSAALLNEGGEAVEAIVISGAAIARALHP